MRLLRGICVGVLLATAPIIAKSRDVDVRHNELQQQIKRIRDRVDSLALHHATKRDRAMRHSVRVMNLPPLIECDYGVDPQRTMQCQVGYECLRHESIVATMQRAQSDLDDLALRLTETDKEELEVTTGVGDDIERHLDWIRDTIVECTRLDSRKVGRIQRILRQSSRRCRGLIKLLDEFSTVFFALKVHEAIFALNGLCLEIDTLFPLVRHTIDTHDPDTLRDHYNRRIAHVLQSVYESTDLPSEDFGII
jgi:hypothetical protein